MLASRATQSGAKGRDLVLNAVGQHKPPVPARLAAEARRKASGSRAVDKQRLYDSSIFPPVKSKITGPIHMLQRNWVAVHYVTVLVLCA